jgi:hypothetical protein
MVIFADHQHSPRLVAQGQSPGWRICAAPFIAIHHGKLRTEIATNLSGPFGLLFSIAGSICSTAAGLKVPARPIFTTEGERSFRA